MMWCPCPVQRAASSTSVGKGAGGGGGSSRSPKPGGTVRQRRTGGGSSGTVKAPGTSSGGSMWRFYTGDDSPGIRMYVPVEGECERCG